MEDQQNKSQRIKETIQATIDKAKETEEIINTTDDPKERQELIEKNERRSQAVSSMIGDFNEEVAQQELDNDSSQS